MYYIKKTMKHDNNPDDTISKILGVYDDLQSALECLEYIYRSLKSDMYELYDRYRSNKTLLCNMLLSSNKEYCTFTCKEVQSKSIQVYMNIVYEHREHIPMVSTAFQDKFKDSDEEYAITYKVIPMV